MPEFGRMVKYPRRLATALVGNGPWRQRPFTEIAAQRSKTCVHRAEEFTGRVAEVPSTVVHYSPSKPLLAQVPAIEQVNGRPRYRADGAHVAPPKTVFALSDAGVATAEGVVYCRRTRSAVSETVRSWTRETKDHPLFTAPRFPAARVLRGLTLNLLTLGGEGFYHFVVEALPRLHLVANLLDDVDQVLVNGRAGGFQESWLEAAGVRPDRIVWASPLSHFHCDDLLFTSPVVEDSLPDVWVREALHETIGVIPATSATRRIWISRGDAGARHLAWEEDLLARLPGFEKVLLSRMSAPEQIETVRTAAVIAGPHGAGLSHVLFAPVGIRLVELFPSPLTRPLFARCAVVSGGQAAWASVDFSEARDLDSLAAAILRFVDAPSPTADGVAAQRNVFR